jgi:hypothetical protein
VENSQRIAKLKARISELQKVLAEDLKASHHEPGQTQEMLKLMERQLDELEHPGVMGESTDYYLVDSAGKQLLIKLVEQNPNPFENIFSSGSEFGKQLGQLKKGQQISLRGITYTLS